MKFFFFRVSGIEDPDPGKYRAYFSKKNLKTIFYLFSKMYVPDMNLVGLDRNNGDDMNLILIVLFLLFLLFYNGY